MLAPEDHDAAWHEDHGASNAKELREFASRSPAPATLVSYAADAEVQWREKEAPTRMRHVGKKLTRLHDAWVDSNTGEPTWIPDSMRRKIH